MPELPEVETIRIGAKKKLVGKTIKSIEVKVQRLFKGNCSDIINSRIIDIKRVGKVLQVLLNNNQSILIHLKMTGQLVYQPKDKKISCAVGGHMQKAYGSNLPHKHTHIIYTFSDGSKLYFNDLRKFGWNKVILSKDKDKFLGPDKFGPEPKTKEFNINYLKKIFQTNKKIKEVLIDQQKISGMGNIYSNDALYWAGILLDRIAKSLNNSEIKKLKNSIEKVISLGLKYGGSSENTYVNIEGKRGKYMDMTATYQQKTDPKGHLLKRQKIGSRSAFYCGLCQK